MGSKDKMMHSKWIANLITTSREEAMWVVVGPGVASQKINKHTLSFKAKARWTLAQHRLCPTTRDNVLSLVCAALIAGLMARYEFDVT